jgi:hypothetical protein|tara:strand:+ start:1279 stop:1449 length:171 start_codon:yes stop_codon:yes gene_type:complete
MAEEIGQPIHPYQHQKEHSETLGEDWWDDRRPTQGRAAMQKGPRSSQQGFRTAVRE